MHFNLCKANLNAKLGDKSAAAFYYKLEGQKHPLRISSWYYRQLPVCRIICRTKLGPSLKTSARTSFRLSLSRFRVSSSLNSLFSSCSRSNEELNKVSYGLWSVWMLPVQECTSFARNCRSRNVGKFLWLNMPAILSWKTATLNGSGEFGFRPIHLWRVWA